MESLNLKLDRLAVNISEISRSISISEIREFMWPNSKHFWNGDYRILYSGSGDGNGGAGFILRKRVAHIVVRIWSYNERKIIIKHKAVSMNLVLVQVYIPTSECAEPVPSQKEVKRIEKVVILLKAIVEETRERL